MKMRSLIWACACAGAAILLQPAVSRADAAAEGEIKTLENSFAAAFKAKDVDAVMKVYVPDDTLVIFDVVPPRQYVGATAYRKDWEQFLGSFDGPVKFELTDLAVVAEGNVGFGHSIQHVVGKDKKGQVIDFTVRVTDGYRKVDGHWLVAHEHVSVPVDLDTNKPDLQSKP